VIPPPLSGIVFGEEGALLTTVILPVAALVDVGEYCALNVLAWPGFNEIGSATAAVLKPLPVTLNCVIVRTPVPVLLN
jgi:hypothetical protein